MKLSNAQNLGRSSIWEYHMVIEEVPPANCNSLGDFALKVCSLKFLVDIEKTSTHCDNRMLKVFMRPKSCSKDRHFSNSDGTSRTTSGAHLRTLNNLPFLFATPQAQCHYAFSDFLTIFQPEG